MLKAENTQCLYQSRRTALLSTDSVTWFQVLEKVWWTNSTRLQGGCPRRGETENAIGHMDLFLVGSAGLLWLAGALPVSSQLSCPPFCVLQVLEACNYISQAPVRFWEWREPVRGGEAQGREKQHFLLSQMTSRVAAAEWHWAWALLQPQSMNLPNLHWKCYEYLKEVFGRLLITFIRLPKKYGILKIIRKWRQGCLSITYIPSGSGTSLSPRWDSGRNIYLFLLLFILDLFIFTLCLTFSLWSIFIMYITY